MSEVRIQPCIDADWPRALALLQTVFVGEGFVSLERSAQHCRRDLLEPAGVLLTAVDDGDLLGAVVLPHRGSHLMILARGDEAEIRMLAVGPRARGRGVGELLVRECLARAANPPLSAKAMVLWTQPGMKSAQRLYERLGFRRVPERDALM